MSTPVSAITRSATRDLTKPLNIIDFCTHERYQAGLAKTGHNFYCWRTLDNSIKDWDETYAPLPSNYTLLNPEDGNNQLPEWIDFDIILSQNKFGQFPVAKQLSDHFGIPMISLEHTLPVPSWGLAELNLFYRLRGDVNVFISEFSRKAWGWEDSEAKVIHHGIDTDLFAPQTIPKKKHILSVVNDLINRNWCKPAGQKILTDMGYIPIEKIKIGNLVLTDGGEYHRVINTMERDYFGDMVEIKLSKDISAKFTPTHNIKVYRDKQWKYVDATRIRKGDILKYPKHIQTDFTFNDQDMAWLIGIIIGDGSITNKGTIQICFNKEEIENATKTQKIMESITGHATISERDREKKNILIVECTSKIFGNWLKTFIKSKAEKSIPNFIINGSEIIRLKTLQGLWAADGSFKNGKNNSPRACYTTISPKLASQVSALSHSFGIKSSLSRVKRTTNKSNGTELPIYRVTSNGKDNFEKCKNLIHNGIINDPYSYVIQDVEIHREWNGKVYNCEVEIDHSYVTYPGFVVHNCCGYDLWQNITQQLPVFPVGKTPGLSFPAKDLAELVKFYNEAQVFVNTSLVSPVPTALLEAMSCGCAVVTTGNCMLPEIIQNGYNGYISNNPKELRSYLEMLLNNPKKCQELGENARKTILEKFSMEAFVERWNKLLYEAVK